MVSVVIINYNTFVLTCNCIASICQFTKAIEYEIIMVDNASTECNPDLFKAKFPFITLVKSDVNTGFAVGNNLGIKHAKGEIILLLNSDTLLNEDAISKTAAILNKNVSIGVIGCRMIYPDGTIQHTARKFRNIGWELLDMLRPFLLLMPYKKRAKLMQGKYFQADFDTFCDWLNGAFFMFRREVLKGFPDNKLDERFFMYGEDHLWCWQIQKLGYKIFFYAGSTIIHINSGSTNPSKQLGLKKIMMKHELEIIRERKGKGMYFFVFRFLFSTKEYFRYAVKWLIYITTKRNLR